jgi:hypothetical protein
MSLFRAEEMTTLAGAIRVEVDGTSRLLVNGSELELHDATLIDFAGNGDRKENYLGLIAAGASADIVASAATPAPQRTVETVAGPDPNTILQVLRTTFERRDENAGEIRLVAWVPRSMGGQVIDPPVDRQRGFTAVLVHLRCGPPPNPGGKSYNVLAMGPEKGPAAGQGRGPGWFGAVAGCGVNGARFVTRRARTDGVTSSTSGLWAADGPVSGPIARML